MQRAAGASVVLPNDSSAAVEITLRFASLRSVHCGTQPAAASGGGRPLRATTITALRCISSAAIFPRRRIAPGGITPGELFGCAHRDDSGLRLMAIHYGESIKRGEPLEW